MAREPAGGPFPAPPVVAAGRRSPPSARPAVHPSGQRAIAAAAYAAAERRVAVRVRNLRDPCMMNLVSRTKVSQAIGRKFAGLDQAHTASRRHRLRRLTLARSILSKSSARSLLRNSMPGALDGAAGSGRSRQPRGVSRVLRSSRRSPATAGLRTASIRVRIGCQLLDRTE